MEKGESNSAHKQVTGHKVQEIKARMRRYMKRKMHNAEKKAPSNNYPNTYPLLHCHGFGSRAGVRDTKSKNRRNPELKGRRSGTEHRTSFQDSIEHENSHC